VALIIRKIKQEPRYLEKNFFYQNPLHTFQVLNKVQAIDRRLISAGLLARLTKFLISLELQPGGPYGQSDSEPDFKLNTEIALFLKNQGINLPNLTPFNQKTRLRGGENDQLLAHIFHLVKKSLRSLPKPFRQVIKTKVDAIISSDSDRQILLLSYFFKLALGQNGSRITPETIYDLSLANLWLWLSYSIYDDLIDNEESLTQLPSGNWAAREFILLINRQRTSAEYRSLFKKIMTQMDYRQVWERRYARFKPGQEIIISATASNYQKPSALYHKSLAHALGPLLILDQLKKSPNSESGKNVLSFFKYYLSVRQMQDDIYDLESDLEHGIITAANINLIKKHINPEQTRGYFLKRELPRLNAKISKYQNLAEEYLRAATIIKHPDYLQQFLEPLKVNPAGIQEFLSVYQSNTPDLTY